VPVCTFPKRERFLFSAGNGTTDRAARCVISTPTKLSQPVGCSDVTVFVCLFGVVAAGLQTVLLKLGIFDEICL
jgi:hypothetical protein